MITKREQEMIALQDRGLNHDQIAASLGLKVSYVRTRLISLSIGGDGAREYRRIAIASANLAKAIATYHPERIGARP